MRIVFRSEAQAELLEARSWYEERASGLGMEFGRAFEVALLDAARRPFSHPAVEAELRRVLLRRFPYGLFYRVRADELVVVAVFHHRRDPGMLLGRSGQDPPR